MQSAVKRGVPVPSFRCSVYSPLFYPYFNHLPTSRMPPLVFLDVFLSCPSPDVILDDFGLSSLPQHTPSSLHCSAPLGTFYSALESAADALPLNPQVWTSPCWPWSCIFMTLPLTQTFQPPACSFSSFLVSPAFLPACTLWCTILLQLSLEQQQGLWCPTLHAVKNPCIALQSALCIHGSTSTDSTNCVVP